MIPGATPIKDFLFSFLMRSRHGVHTRLRTNDHMHARRLADTLHTREPTHVAHTHTRTRTHTRTHICAFFFCGVWGTHSKLISVAYQGIV